MRFVTSVTIAKIRYQLPVFIFIVQCSAIIDKCQGVQFFSHGVILRNTSASMSDIFFQTETQLLSIIIQKIIGCWWEGLTYTASTKSALDVVRQHNRRWGTIFRATFLQASFGGENVEPMKIVVGENTVL